MEPVIVYNPEGIIKNLYFGIISHFARFTNQIDSFNVNELTFELFLMWLGDLYSKFKSLIGEKYSQKPRELFNNIQRNHAKSLNINRQMFKSFPKETNIFYMYPNDHFLLTTVKKSDLFLNQINGPVRCTSIINKNSYFDNFTQPYQMKIFNNLIMDLASKCENMFDTYSNTLMACEQRDFNIRNVERVNSEFVENFDFVIFCLKYFSSLCQFQCLKSWLTWLKCKNSDKPDYNNDIIYNNLQDLDCTITQQLFAHLLFFSSHNNYAIDSSPNTLKWNIIFPTSQTNSISEEKNKMDFF
jgi:hypothetical protein